VSERDEAIEGRSIPSANRPKPRQAKMESVPVTATTQP
jgi:hypothetical protein